MADRLTVMLSSRVDDPTSSLPDGTTMRELRDQLCETIEEVTLPGTDDALFDVFVNEGAGAQAADADVEAHCRARVAAAQLVLVLYNGSAGWASQGLQGICMAELKAAMDVAPHKVRVIRLPLIEAKKKVDRDFQRYFEDHRPFATDSEVDTVEDITAQCLKALREAVVEMVTQRARDGSLRAARSRGDAFTWARMSMAERAREMRAAGVSALKDSREAKAVGRDGHLVAVPWGGSEVLFRVDAVPAAMSVAPAREMVGQPFLRDHELSGELGERSGPVHLVLVQGGATEAQAARQLGSPDATIVPTDFGVYVADEIQKVQMIFVARCIDTQAIVGRIQTLLNWLEATAEGDRLALRAADRAKLVKLIADLRR